MRLRTLRALQVVDLRRPGGAPALDSTPSLSTQALNMHVMRAKAAAAAAAAAAPSDTAALEPRSSVASVASTADQGHAGARLPAGLPAAAGTLQGGEAAIAKEHVMGLEPDKRLSLYKEALAGNLSMAMGAMREELQVRRPYWHLV